MRGLARQLDVLATALRHLSGVATRLRRSASNDAQRLVDLEGRVDASVRAVRSLQPQRQEPR
jgi:hypothetical protein